MNSLLPVLFQPKPDTIYNFDALQLLRLLPDESVNCCVTSPPYYSLRNYQVNGQIGLEETPEQYVDALVTVFRELRRVMRRDGVLWLNLGDSFSSHASGAVDDPFRASGLSSSRTATAARQAKVEQKNYRNAALPEKNLLMIPSRVALALQADGWYLRSMAPWVKRSAMPESTTDRPTTATEYIFLLTKSPRYWYDVEAIREPARDWGPRDRTNNKYHNNGTGLQPHKGLSKNDFAISGRNRRNTDWYFEALDAEIAHLQTLRGKGGIRLDDAGLPLAFDIVTEPSPLGHFAMFPESLIRPMVLAGCPPKVCSACGAPYQRIDDGERVIDTNRPQARRALELFEAKGLTDDHLNAMRAVGLADAGKALVTMNGAGKNTAEQQRLAAEAKAALGGYYREFLFSKRSSNGWNPTCDCHAPHDSGIVIDPFMGAGTVALVAQRLNRHWIGCDLNPEYVRLATMRVQGRLAEYMAEQRGEPHSLYMFAEEGGVA